MLGNSESVASGFEDFETLAGGFVFFMGDKNAVRIKTAAADSAADLVKLRQAELLGK